MPPMTGGCLCGAVRYESTGEPGFALLCHCRDCQRQSGSAFAAGWRVPAASFRVTQGAPKLYVRDTGLLHSLLGMRFEKGSLLSHLKAGASYESFAIEQILTLGVHGPAHVHVVLP